MSEKNIHKYKYSQGKLVNWSSALFAKGFVWVAHTYQNIAEDNRIGHNAKSVHSFQYIVNMNTDTNVESNTDVEKNNFLSKASKKTITNANMK